MLVDRGFAHAGVIEPLTRCDHRCGPLRELVRLHPAPHDRHQQRRGLFVGHLVGGVRVDEPADLFTRQGAAIPLGSDQVDDVEAGH
jgi:hypothetical protein